MGVLALDRGTRDQVVIDGPCVITVKSANRGRVRLVFVAEQSTKIIRGEVYERDHGPVSVATLEQRMKEGG